MSYEYDSKKIHRIAIILISPENKFLAKFELYDRSLKDIMRENVIICNVYTKNQLNDIFELKCKALAPEVKFSTEARELILDKSLKSESNAKFLIELISKTVETAEKYQTQIIKPDIVNSALKSIIIFSKGLFESLSLTHQLYLMSIAELTKNKIDKNEFRVRDIRKSMILFASEFGIIKYASGKTTLWLVTKDLVNLEFIRSRTVSKSKRGRFTLLSLSPELTPQFVQQELVNTLNKRGFIQKHRVYP